jgi:hypothetical protein
LQNTLYKIFTIYNTTNIGITHNGIQDILVVWGIPGMALFISYIYCIIKSSLSEVKKHKLANYIPLLLILLHVQSGQLIHSYIALLSFAYGYIALCSNFEEEVKENVQKIS